MASPRSSHFAVALAVAASVVLASATPAPLHAQDLETADDVVVPVPRMDLPQLEQAYRAECASSRR